MCGVILFWTLSPFYNNTPFGATLLASDINELIIFKEPDHPNDTEGERMDELETLQGDQEPSSDSDIDDKSLDTEMDNGALNQGGSEPVPPVYSSLDDYPVQEIQEGDTNSLAGNTAISDLASESDLEMFLYDHEFSDID